MLIRSFRGKRKNGYPGVGAFGLAVINGAIGISTPAVSAAHDLGATGAVPPTMEREPIPARRPLLKDTEQAWQVGLHLDGEVVSDARGGDRQGAAYDNVTHLAMASDSQPLGLWSGGRLALSVIDIRGTQPSGRFIGDTQGVSNIEAETATRLYQFWYRQHWAQAGVTARAGIFDVNEFMAATDSASILMNASFGLTPTIAVNVPTSTYPKPTWGTLIYIDRGAWQFQGALFQGDPARRQHVFGEGHMGMVEVDHSMHSGVRWKLGLWSYQAPEDATAVPDDSGAYGIVEWPIRRPSARPLRAFLQVGANPGSNNPVPHYIGLGATTSGIFPNRPDDLAAFGIAAADVEPGKWETAVELSYVVRIARHLFVQPDLQYIRHPGGSSRVEDAVVASVRLHMEFF